MSFSAEDKFTAFLLANAGHPELIGHITRRFSPFFWKAEQRTYSLSPGWEVSVDRAAGAVASAAGGEAGNAKFVSLRDIFAATVDEDCLGLGADSGDPGRIWEWTHGRPFWKAFQDVWRERFRSAAGTARAELFREAVRTHLLDQLAAAVYGDVGAVCPNLDAAGLAAWFALRDRLWRLLDDCLTCYAAFWALGDAAAVSRLSPLVRLLPEAIPLAERPSEPGAWLFLAA